MANFHLLEKWKELLINEKARFTKQPCQEYLKGALPGGLIDAQ
jgi:hypothetical protein